MVQKHEPGKIINMKRNPQVIAFMTPFPYSIDVDAPIERARELMLEHHFRHLPVTSGESVVGILADRDIKLVSGPEFGSPDPRQLTVRDVYVERPCIVPASTPVAKVARTMAENHIGSAIVTKNDKLVGIFTVTDACRALADIIGGHGEETNDAA
jgi:acetoin utilization protein AcuB